MEGQLKFSSATCPNFEFWRAQFWRERQLPVLDKKFTFCSCNFSTFRVYLLKIKINLLKIKITKTDCLQLTSFFSLAPLWFIFHYLSYLHLYNLLTTLIFSDSGQMDAEKAEADFVLYTTWVCSAHYSIFKLFQVNSLRCSLSTPLEAKYLVNCRSFAEILHTM